MGVVLLLQGKQTSLVINKALGELFQFDREEKLCLYMEETKTNVEKHTGEYKSSLVLRHRRGVFFVIHSACVLFQ